MDNICHLIHLLLGVMFKKNPKNIDIMGQLVTIPTLFDHTKTKWFTCLKDLFKHIVKYETVGMHLK